MPLRMQMQILMRPETSLAKNPTQNVLHDSRPQMRRDRAFLWWFLLSPPPNLSDQFHVPGPPLRI